MLSDEQFGHRLGVQFRNATEELNVEPDLVGKLRRRQAQRTWAVRAAIVTPVAAVAVAAIVATSAGLGAPAGGHDAAQSTNGSSVQLQNVAYVQQQTAKALSEVSQYVMYEKTVTDDYDLEVWDDPTTNGYRSNFYYTLRKDDPSTYANAHVRPFPLQGSYANTGPDNQTGIWVDYHEKTWRTGPGNSGVSTRFDPERLRKEITDGKWKLLGKENVDGVDTLHLGIEKPIEMPAPPDAPGPWVDLTELWVDSKTYMFVQHVWTVTLEGQTKAKHTSKYSWLPRTDENLAKLVLTPPAGFKNEGYQP
jgi:hypothetical protein